MERLVHVRLRHGDIILEPSGDRLIDFVNNTQGCIAVFYGIHFDPDGKEIIDLIQRPVLVHHLLIDAEIMFDAPVDFTLNLRFLHMLPDFLDHMHDEIVLGVFTCFDILYQLVEYIRLRIFQSQVIQFDLDRRNTETLGDRRVDIHRLPGFFLLFFAAHVLERAHVVEPVGQFDDNDTDIPGHSQKHFPEVLRLYFDFIRGIFDLGQLGNAVHKKRDFLAEFPFDILEGHIRIFDHIVEDRRGDRLFIHFQLCENDRHLNRMADVGLPGFPELVPMGVAGHIIRFLYHGKIIRRMILAHRLDQLVI